MLGPAGLASVGLPLLVGGETGMLYATITNLLSDGDGHRQALDWKGASSLKPCFKHFNVFEKGSCLSHRRPGFVEVTCSVPSEFRSWSPRQVYNAVDTLAAARSRVEAGLMTKADFGELEVSMGLNYNPLGLLASTALRHLGPQRVRTAKPAPPQ